MELSTVARLADLNRRFYLDHAENFADARPRLQPGARRLLARLPPGARVLDAGCGDGQAARALPQAHYTGLDQSAPLLARAREFTARHAPSSTAEFIECDLLAEDLPARLPPGPFDWVLALAVFHHLPGAATRQRVLSALAAGLAPSGTLALSTWQFHTSPRLLGRQVAWSAIGLSESDVEPGDALLRWERKGRHGLRYVHALAEAEARDLVASAGLAVTEVFASDGVTGDLATYVLGQRARP